MLHIDTHVWILPILKLGFLQWLYDAILCKATNQVLAA